MNFVTYKYKVLGKDSVFNYLDKLAREVNIVWNYCNEISIKIYKNKINTHYFEYDPKTDKRVRKKYPNPINKTRINYSNVDIGTYKKGQEQFLEITPGFISGFDLEKLLGGTRGLLEIPSSSVAAVCQEYDKSKQTKIKQISKGAISSSSRNFIGFRGKKDRPWIPIKGCSIKFDHQSGVLIFNKKRFKLNIDRPIDGDIRDAKFVKEPTGWFVCISIKQEKYTNKFKNNDSGILGVDFGLSTFATRSDGLKIDISEPKVRVFGKEFELSTAIDYLKSKRDKLKNKKLFNSKYYFLDKKIKKLELFGKEYRKNKHFNAAYELMSGCETLVLGDLSGKFIQSMSGKKSKTHSIGLARDRINWIALKSNKKAVWVNEKDTTNTCSGCREKTGPSGFDGLNIRNWTCSSCGETHDRDVNAAKNMIHVHFRELHN